MFAKRRVRNELKEWLKELKVAVDSGNTTAIWNLNAQQTVQFMQQKGIISQLLAIAQEEDRPLAAAACLWLALLRNEGLSDNNAKNVLRLVKDRAIRELEGRHNLEATAVIWSALLALSAYRDRQADDELREMSSKMGWEPAEATANMMILFANIC